MPLAAPIPATSSSISSAIPLTLSTKDATGKAAATGPQSGQVFGALVREKASAIEASSVAGTTVPKAASTVAAAPKVLPKAVSETQEVSEATGLSASPDTTAAAAAAAGADLTSLDPSTAEPASGGDALRAFQPSQQWAEPASPSEAEENAATGTNPDKPRSSLEAADVAQSEVNVAATTARSTTNPWSSTQTAHPQPKSKEAGSTDKPIAASTAALAPVAQPPVPLAAPAVLTAMSSGPQRAVAVFNRSETSAGPIRNPSVSAPPGDSIADPALAPQEKSQAALAAQPALQASTISSNTSESAAHSSADTGTVSKISYSAAPASHPGHAAAAQAENATTTAGANPLTPVGAHPAGTEAAAPPHVDPAASPTALATPAAGAAPAPAASPYDRIDQGDSPVVLHTDAQHVAVGIRDPQLGWVEIKTQNTAGHVDATLVASSSQTHDALAAQLPAMAQYLEQRDVRVGTLAVHHPILQSNTGGGQSGGFSSGAGSGGGGAQHFNQSGSGHQDAAERFPGVSSGLLHSPSSSRAVSVEDSGSSLRPVSYISVRA